MLLLRRLPKSRNLIAIAAVLAVALSCSLDSPSDGSDPSDPTDPSDPSDPPTSAYVVRFHSNGGTSENLASDVRTVEVDSGSLAVPGNPDGLVYEGKVFLGWTTGSDGSGDGYAEGMALSVESDVDLWALWIDESLIEISEGDDGITVLALDPSYSGTFIAPPGTVSIDYGALSDCVAVTAVILPDTLTTIVDWAFRGCSALSEVYLPDSIATIGEGAFTDCASLAEVDLPEGLTAISPSLFEQCAVLKTIAIPAGVATIGERAFSKCPSLESIALPAGLKAFDTASFSYCTALGSVVIPEGVSRVSDSLFFECTGLTEVTVSSTVTIIDDFAFGGCPSLNTLRMLPAVPPALEDYVFIRGSENLTIRVPNAAALAAYKASSDWASYNITL